MLPFDESIQIKNYIAKNKASFSAFVPVTGLSTARVKGDVCTCQRMKLNWDQSA